MDQINTGKLIKTSKTMLIILRILFILLILMAIIPWLAPTNGISKFLLSMQGFLSVIEGHHKNIDEFMSMLTPLSRLFGFIASTLTLIPLILSTLIMIRLSNNYVSGKVFNLDNAKSYRQLGIIYLLSALLLQPISDMFFSLCVTINNPVGQRVIAFGINTINITAIFFAMMLIIIGQVMKFGQKISEEQELTV